ncbi:hypothetical protein PSPO01_01378 [Paraphaeosphaeria sporulosa]
MRLAWCAGVGAGVGLHQPTSASEWIGGHLVEWVPRKLEETVSSWSYCMHYRLKTFPGPSDVSARHGSLLWDRAGVGGVITYVLMMS